MNLRLLFLALLATPAWASHYVSFTGGYEQLPTSDFSAAFTNAGFSGPSSGRAVLGTRLGNESPGGALRLEAILNHPLTLAKESGSNYVELSTNRWGVQIQMSLLPGVVFSPVLGLGGGVAFADLTVLTPAGSGVMSHRYFYAEPVVGAEMRLSPDFRFFAELGYTLPFSSRKSSHGSATGATGLDAHHWSASVGLSFYFSR